MDSLNILKSKLETGALEADFLRLYAGAAPLQPARYQKALSSFCRAFPKQREAAFFSAPGRSEIGGNHTDHQLGRVLAAAVTMDMIAVTAKTEERRVCIHSEGYAPLIVDLTDLSANPHEKNTSQALVRGIAAQLRALGYTVGGFEAVVTSNVPKGSGLSSSAAYSILIGSIFSGLYNEMQIPPIVLAQTAQFAENAYFGKPSGLMDQLASSVGGFVAIDFRDRMQPVIEPINCDLDALGYSICIVDAHGSHADLTPEYAAIPNEMRSVAAYFGKTVLREVAPERFFAAIGALRKQVSDRAILRAIHFFEENERVPLLVEALRQRNMQRVIALMNASGDSSFMQLQNVCPTEAKERSLALALAMSARMLSGRGAWRVHGGGFAGTIQALIPKDAVDAYCTGMETVFGEGCCYRLSVRPVGGVMLK